MLPMFSIPLVFAIQLVFAMLGLMLASLLSFHCLLFRQWLPCYLSVHACDPVIASTFSVLAFLG